MGSGHCPLSRRSGILRSTSLCVVYKAQHDAYKGSGWGGVMAALIGNDKIGCYSLKGHSRIEEDEAETVSV